MDKLTQGASKCEREERAGIWVAGNGEEEPMETEEAQPEE